MVGISSFLFSPSITNMGYTRELLSILVSLTIFLSFADVRSLLGLIVKSIFHNLFSNFIGPCLCQVMIPASGIDAYYQISPGCNSRELKITMFPITAYIDQNLFLSAFLPDCLIDCLILCCRQHKKSIFRDRYRSVR